MDMNTATPDLSPGMVEAPAGFFGKLKFITRQIGWILLGISLLVLFTLFKFPEDRIKAYIDGSIQAQLSPLGLSYTAKSSNLTTFPMISYDVEGVTLRHSPPGGGGFSMTPKAPEFTSAISRIEVAPSILPLFLGRMGGNVAITQGEGKLATQASIRGSSLDMTLTADRMDLGKIGILPYFAKIKGAWTVTGGGNFTGDLAAPPSWNGRFELKGKNLVIEQQSIMGFTIPQALKVSESNAVIRIADGRITIESFTLGKKGNASDDIYLTASGDIKLAKDFEASTANLKLQFTLSQNVLKISTLIQTLLSQFRQGEGSYQLSLTGPMRALTPGK